MRILAVGAHPDDLEICCAGTLAKMVAAGHEVVLCHASSGDKGHYHIPPDELSRIRTEEAKEAASIIGCQSISLGLKDCEISSENEQIQRVFIDLIREVRPDMAITHAPNDYMPDHVAVSKLLFDTTFFASIRSYPTLLPETKKIPAIFYMDNLSGIAFQPTIYVDVSDTFQTKINMLSKHQSQLTWLQEHDNVDVIDLVRTAGKMRGIQAGCAYAEGFIQHMAWTRPNALRFPV